jgi:hypothetical protein
VEDLLLPGEVVSFQQALFWMNIQLELLAADHRALRRMRDVLTVYADSPEDFERDIRLHEIELDRVMDRLKHWEGVVARLRPAAD